MNAATDWERWRADRAEALSVPHGWLSLTGFAWLTTRPEPVEGLPGRWWSAGGEAQVEAHPEGHADAAGSDGLLVEDKPVDGIVSARVEEAGSLLWVRHGERLVELVRRGGRYAVRVRDPQASTRRSFSGVPAFDYDEAWVRPGRFQEYPHARTVTVATARGDLTQQATLVGLVEVDIGGEAFALEATQGGGVGLTLAFRDETNGTETAPWRVVTTTVPAADGSVSVDFNRAVNLPFAFTDFRTCPAPVQDNVLPVPVRAGERAPA